MPNHKKKLEKEKFPKIANQTSVIKTNNLQQTKHLNLTVKFIGLRIIKNNRGSIESFNTNYTVFFFGQP